MREKNSDKDSEMLSDSFRTTAIASSATAHHSHTPKSHTNVWGQGSEEIGPSEDHLQDRRPGETLRRSACNDSPVRLIDQIPHLIEITEAAPTRTETLLPESGLSQMNAMRYFGI
jgi:hypothetical protein